MRTSTAISKTVLLPLRPYLKYGRLIGWVVRLTAGVLAALFFWQLRDFAWLNEAAFTLVITASAVVYALGEGLLGRLPYLKSERVWQDEIDRLMSEAAAVWKGQFHVSDIIAGDSPISWCRAGACYSLLRNAGKRWAITLFTANGPVSLKIHRGQCVKGDWSNKWKVELSHVRFSYHRQSGTAWLDERSLNVIIRGPWGKDPFLARLRSNLSAFFEAVP